MSDVAPPPVAKRPTQRFRRSADTVRLSEDQKRRQGSVAQSAWLVLGGRDAAVEFLNAHDDTLGGRPIDVAIESDGGLGRVVEMLEARAAAR